MKRILVGIDDSPRTPEVLATARLLAEKLDGKLILVHAIGLPPGVPPEYYTFPPDRLPELLERDARKVLEKWAAQVPPERVESLRARVGTAWNLLCSIAHDEKVDLIIIGSHGYGGIDRVLGTTASRVVNHADCSVMVVRPARP
jgi:universal stress protein F